MSRIKEWPEDERPREKLLQHGAVHLSTAELLALVLRCGDARSGQTALDQARNLIKRFGNLRQLGHARTAELCEFPGIGPARAAEIQAVLELAKRFAAESMQPGTRYTSSTDAFNHFHPRLRDFRREVFIALLLDSKNCLLREIQISEGSLNASIVHPREVFVPVVRESAAAVLFVHNHPSGDPSPSQEDISLTTRLKQAGDLMGVRVLDHIIIGDGRYHSFADQGML